MTENEQIEEMAKEIYEPCTGSCKACEYYLHPIDNVGCMAINGARKIYDKGYRKASEVAEEIIKSLIDFVDCKERLHPTFLNCSWCVDSDDITDFISEIKKKYTEERNNDRERAETHP